jgi:methionine aminotransferase
MTFCTNTPAQYAFSRMLEDAALYKNLGAFYQHKRDTFRSLLEGSRLELLPCEGSYFQLARYDGITHEHDTTLAVRLTKEIGVASIPVSVFYTDHTDNHVLRLCFAKTDETLEQAAERLCTL